MDKLNLVVAGAFIFAALSASAAGPATPDAMMSKLIDGPPHLTTKLDPSLYAQTKVQKLANPRIVYVNWQALKSVLQMLGYEHPPTVLTDELARAILDHAAFAAQIMGESPEAYVEGFRTLYSARYGGHWMNDNLGSGRNGAGGAVDIKGIGRTELVRPWAQNDHSSGAMSAGDSIKEAAWSRVLGQELPFGANQVLFIIATGTKADPSDPNSDERTLMVRADATRPAYLQPNISVTDKRMSDDERLRHYLADQSRLSALLPRLLEIMPMPSGLSSDASPAEKMRASVFEFVDRASYQYATQFTRQSLSGGISTSNIEVSGSALDFGSSHALLGFPQARVDKDESPHGTTKTIKNDLILEFAQDLREQLPRELADAVPTPAELRHRVSRQFARRVSQGFLELAGTPREISEKMVEQKSGLALAKTLEKIARAGNSRVEEFREGTIVGRTGTYNLARVLKRSTELMATESNPNSLLNDAELSKALPSKELRLELLKRSGAYSRDLASWASTEGISRAALDEYIKIAVRARNRPYYGLREKWTFWPRASKAIRGYFSGDEFAVQNFLDLTVERNVHEFASRPYTIETSDPTSLKNGVIRHQTFDLKTGKTTVLETLLPSRNAEQNRRALERDARAARKVSPAGRCESIFG